MYMCRDDFTDRLPCDLLVIQDIYSDRDFRLWVLWNFSAYNSISFEVNCHISYKDVLMGIAGLTAVEYISNHAEITIAFVQEAKVPLVWTNFCAMFIA